MVARSHGLKLEAAPTPLTVLWLPPPQPFKVGGSLAVKLRDKNRVANNFLLGSPSWFRSLARIVVSAVTTEHL
eukprot:2579639-Amphidinium_carterae.1